MSRCPLCSAKGYVGGDGDREPGLKHGRAASGLFLRAQSRRWRDSHARAKEAGLLAGDEGRGPGLDLRFTHLFTTKLNN